MRVLIVTDWNRGQGGAEAYIAWLRDGLRAAGDDVRLLTSGAGSAGDGTADYVAYGTESILAQTVLQVANPFAVRTLRTALREFRPEVVFVNMFAHHLSPAILHVLGRIPAVLSVSDFKCICPIGSKLRPDGSICTTQAGWVCRSAGCIGSAHWLRDRPRYALMRSGVARIDKVIACSEWVRRELGDAGIDAVCEHLPVPGPSAAYRRSPSQHPLFVYCGRLDVEKGLEVLLRAFALTVDREPSSRLRIVGRGRERERLEHLSAELGLDTSVVFTGWLDAAEVERELGSAWALVAPSLWAEPLGLVALEAIVRGVPVIASATGGFAETVEEGVSGNLVPNGDITALAARMTAVARAGSINSCIPPEAVRRIAERHSIGAHVTRIRRIFESLQNSTAPQRLRGSEKTRTDSW
ncbi:MAG: glycosyltransferase family 4 protein [Gemmatimonadales bacterium]